MTLAEAIDKLAAEPLVAHPGTAFNYSLSTDVLGRVVEVASGQPFEVFLRERIFKPLKMTDTDFVVPESKWSRMATVYSPDGSSGIRPMKDPESFGNTHMSPVAYYKSKTYFSGGAGLVSTAADYARFGQMLLNGGSLDGAQILSPKTIELMTVNHTADLPSIPIAGAGYGFGLGFRVLTDLAASQATRLGRAITAGAASTARLLGRSEGEARRDHAGAALSGVNGCRCVPAACVSSAHSIDKVPSLLVQVPRQVLQSGIDRDRSHRPSRVQARAPHPVAALRFKPLDVPAKIPSSLAARRAMARPSFSSIARASS